MERNTGPINLRLHSRQEARPNFSALKMAWASRPDSIPFCMSNSCAAALHRPLHTHGFWAASSSTCTLVFCASRILWSQSSNRHILWPMAFNSSKWLRTKLIMPGPPEDLAKDSTRSSKHGQSGRMPSLTSTGHKSASRKRQADLPWAALLLNSETRSSSQTSELYERCMASAKHGWVLGYRNGSGSKLSSCFSLRGKNPYRIAMWYPPGDQKDQPKKATNLHRPNWCLMLLCLYAFIQSQKLHQVLTGMEDGTWV